MTAGFRSTELWVCLAGFALALALLALGRYPECAGLAAVSVWTYGHSRGKAKGRPYRLPGSGV